MITIESMEDLRRLSENIPKKEKMKVFPKLSRMLCLRDSVTRIPFFNLVFYL